MSMFNETLKNDKTFLFAVITLALLVRMIIAPLYISTPGEGYSVVPHDFEHYIADAKAVLEGKILYIEPTHTDGKPAPYGPLFMTVMAGLIKIFGENYLVLKLPAILADIGIIFVLFHLVKNFLGSTRAKYATLFYAFSLMPLLISGADATADLPLVLFLIASVFYLTKEKPNILISAILLAISAGFKIPPSLIVFGMVSYYFFQAKEFRKIFLFAGMFAMTLALINLPFLIKAGANVFIQVTYGLQDPVGGTSLQSFANILVNYFIYGVDERTREPNPTIMTISFPILLVSTLSALAYIVKFSLKDKKIELIRNSVLLMLVLTIFVKMSHWHIFYWSVPFIFVLMSYMQKEIKTFNISKLEIAGILMLILSAISYAALYRWTKIPEYTALEQVTLLIGIGLSTIGTWFMMNRNNFKGLWTFSTFSWNIWLTDHSKLLMLFGVIIPLLRSPIIAFGAHQFISIGLVVLSNLLLLMFVHKTSKV